MIPVLLALLAVSTVAWADGEPVRDDIVDIRHGRMPDRRVFLGWTADGRAVAHQVLCAPQNDNPRCEATLVVATERGAETTMLFSIGEVGLDISTDLASRAIRAERDALAKLGPLTKGAVATDLGLTAEAGCDGVKIKRGSQTLARPIAMTCPGELGDAETPSVSDARIRAVQVAPDHSRVAVSVDYVRTRVASTWHLTTLAVVSVRVQPKGP